MLNIVHKKKELLKPHEYNSCKRFTTKIQRDIMYNHDECLNSKSHI